MQIRIDMFSEKDITDELYNVLKQFDIQNLIITNDEDEPELFM